MKYRISSVSYNNRFSHYIIESKNWFCWEEVKQFDNTYRRYLTYEDAEIAILNKLRYESVEPIKIESHPPIIKGIKEYK